VSAGKLCPHAVYQVHGINGEGEIKMGSTYDTLKNQANAVFRGSRENSYKTRERYEETATRFAKFVGDRYHLNSWKNMQNKHLEDYAKHLQDAGRSVSHIKTELSAIRYLARHIGTKKPLMEARKHNERMEIGRRSFRGGEKLWKEHDLRMIDQAPDRIRDVLILARDLGLRVHEVHRIDTASARAAVKSDSLHVKGKGGRERDVPLRGEASRVLERVLAITDGGQKLFVTEGTLTHHAIREVQDWVYNHRDPSSHVSIHGLRHGYAQSIYKELRASGVPVHEAKLRVSELLGHSREEVTDIYLSSR